MMVASAIVLAGGRSSRFGSDKLRAEIDGQPMLDLVIRAAAEIAVEIVVVTPSSGPALELPSDLTTRTTLVRDADAYPGPLVALVRAAVEANHERLLLLAGDMPHVQPVLLRRLLAWPTDLAGACLVADGWSRPLPIGLDRSSMLVTGTGLIDTGARSLRALIDALPIEQIAETDWRTLDPEARSLQDIDRPEDMP